MRQWCRLLLAVGGLRPLCDGWRPHAAWTFHDAGACSVRGGRQLCGRSTAAECSPFPSFWPGLPLQPGLSPTIQPWLRVLCSAIEAVDGVSGEVEAAIRQALGDCLVDTDLGIGIKKKVRACACVACVCVCALCEGGIKKPSLGRGGCCQHPPPPRRRCRACSRRRCGRCSTIAELTDGTRSPAARTAGQSAGHVRPGRPRAHRDHRPAERI